MNVLKIILIITPACFFGQINWEVYNSENSPLPYNQINDITLDFENNLIIGTEYGLARLNTNENWDVFFDEGKESGLTSNIIKSVYTNLNNDIWACGPDGISIIHTDNTYSYLNTTNTSLPSNFAKSILFENENKIWIGTTGGLALIENDNWILYDFLGMTNIFSNHITKIIKHPNNETLFIGTLNGGLVTYDNEFIFLNNNNSELLDNTIKDLHFDEDENLIITTTFAGLGVWTNTNLWVWFNSQINPSLPFFINSLGDISIDENNNIWIATMEDGLIKYANNNWTFYNSENTNLPDDNINCIKYDIINNKIWIGTQTQGVVSMNLENINLYEDISKSAINIINTYHTNNLIIDSKINATIEILNYSGSIIKTFELKKGLNNIHTGEINSGIYFIYTPELNNHIYQIVKI